MKRVPFNAIPDLVCIEHGIRDMFPCPWPGCENGVSDDCFERALWPSGDETTVFQRFAWDSPLGGSYFSWKEEGLPHYLSLRNTFWNEVRRLKLVAESFPDVIYHYTTMEALVEIVRSGSIWLSDYSYLNDKTELIHGVNVAMDVIDKLLQHGLPEFHEGLLTAWKKNASEQLPRVCVASFSSNGDSLSQWRAYGDVAIGFEPHTVAVHTNQSQLGAVTYKPELQRKLAQVFIGHACQTYAEDMKASTHQSISKTYHRLGPILELVSFFKDVSFHEESEYRLAYVEHPELFEDNLFGDPPPKSFRVKGGRINSHIVSSELFPRPRGDWPLGICEVILGPACDDLMELGVREFLSESGMKEVQVRRSIIPYRT